MSKGTSKKTAIVTGAAKRIGAEIVRELHNIGMDVVLHFNSSTEDARQLAQELNSIRNDSVHLLQADLKQTTACSALIEQAFAINNRIDVLINNASVFYPTSLQECTLQEWDELINVNLTAPFFLIQAAAPYLAKSGGSIINLTDIYAEQPLANHAVYNISKAGLIMLTKTLAKELAPEVRVNAISPGAILWHEDMNEIEKNYILENTALKKLGSVQDIANAVRYLINNARYITGQILVIDGGRSLPS
jgi:pteridine reductase